MGFAGHCGVILAICLALIMGCQNKGAVNAAR